MDKFRIQGGRKLSGAVQVSGSKNAALPILFSTILSGKECTFKRVPRLEDIHTTFKLLEQMGVEVEWEPKANRARVKAAKLASTEAPYDLVRKMRASVVVLGPLLAREGRAKVSLPGGCAIGARPIGFHLQGLEKLGAKITLEGGYVIAEAKKLRGNRVAFPFPSVGATENVMMAATLAEGETILENCAKEPEICDLAGALRAMGAKIEGDGTEVIRIQGVSSLQGGDYSVMGDRIEAGTYLIAGLMTGGKVRVEGIAPRHLESTLVALESSGARIERGAEHVVAESLGRPKAADLTTLPFPGFPTDMQAQFMSLMTLSDGTSVITETIFENRFMHVPELMRLGADITIRGNAAVVRGKEKLLGAPLMATDLRASASLVLGGLAADGETRVNRIYHLDRGYESMEEKLRVLGAEVVREKGD